MTRPMRGVHFHCATGVCFLEFCWGIEEESRVKILGAGSLEMAIFEFR
jgi:hypothetical protein